MKPRVSILSKDFKYVPSYGTDIRRTFARALREQRRGARLAAMPSPEVPSVRLVAANGR